MSVALGLSEQDLIDRLEPWLRQWVGDDALRVRHVSVPGNGASNLTGIVEVDSSDAPPRLVLRTLSSNADQLYENYDLEKQYRIMERLAPTHIKVPKLLHFEADPSVLAREFYVMYDTGGRSVPERPSYHESGWFTEMAPDERRRVWLAGVDTIAAIHGLDWHALGLEFLVPTESGRELNKR